MNKLTITLRIAMGVLVIAAAVATGAIGRSPWIIPPLGFVFSVLYVLGKLRHWRQGIARIGVKGMVAALPATIFAQIVLVGVLYFVALGVRSLILADPEIARFSRFDWLYCGAVLVIFGALAAAIAWLERTLPDPFEEALAGLSAEGGRWPYLLDDIDLLPSSLTPETFFDDIAVAHAQLGCEAGLTASEGSEEKIIAAEQGLGLRLPNGLRALYRYQNGGRISDVWAAASDRRFCDTDSVAHWINLIDDIAPTENLQTVKDAFLPNIAVEDGEHLLIFARREGFALFLDYRDGAPPKVGAADFEDEDWKDHAFYWPDFETFFAVLRREDLEHWDEETQPIDET